MRLRGLALLGAGAFGIGVAAALIAAKKGIPPDQAGPWLAREGARLLVHALDRITGKGGP